MPCEQLTDFYSLAFAPPLRWQRAAAPQRWRQRSPDWTIVGADVFAISPAVALERACSVGLRSPAGQNLLGCLRTRLRAEAAPFPELVGYAASDGAMCTLRLLARLQPLLPKPHAAFGDRVKKPVAESLAALEQIHAWLAQMRHSDPGYSWKTQALAEWMASGPVFDAMQLMDSREWLPVAQAFYERAGGALH